MATLAFHREWCYKGISSLTTFLSFFNHNLEVRMTSTVRAEGKTKRVWSVEGCPDMVIIESKDDMTKNDDPSQTQVMSGKAALSTATTCAVFQLLKDAGIPVAFEKQLGPTKFLSPAVKMIPLEIVWRRYAVGSYLKRHPELMVSEGALPHRFHRSVFELFLKTTGGVIKDFCGNKLGEASVEDPFIANPSEKMWTLVHPKEPSWSGKSAIGVEILSHDILVDETRRRIEKLLRQVGLVLEGAWAQLGCRLIDFKIEMGVASNGELVVADVIDADSWRLRDANWQELSKQLFRDNAEMDLIADKYALVAKLAERFRIPKQAIVVWRGSDKDPLPEIPQMAGVDMVSVVMSGHKSPGACLKKLEELLTLYPEGGVILACVGMSNGLGPTLAARTSWPVIAIPLTAEVRPHDAWSSLEVPSQVPLMTVLSQKNAVLAALNILAQKHPVAYMHRQYALEELDG